MLALQIISAIGFSVSIYALHVERKSTKQKNYKAICDISKNASCTKAFSSPQGKALGVSNASVGIIFYLTIFALAIINKPQIIFYLSALATLASVYLAYLSYIKMKNFCLVCTAIYIINILLLLLSYGPDGI